MKGANRMFTGLLKEVARGKRGARDLTYEEALGAAEAILTGEATPAQIGAFFVAQRIKMESVAELKAFVVKCREQAHRLPTMEGMDCTGPYDGRVRSFYATFATSFVLAEAGLPVTLHGAPTLPPKRGITLHDMITTLGVELNQLSRERAADIAQATGVLYVPAQRWSPAIEALRNIREELDMRTIMSTVEKLIDYAHSPYLVFGVFHNTVFNRMSELVQELAYERALIVQGVEGSEDLFIDRPTRTYYVESGRSELLVIDPELYELAATIPEMEWTASKQVQVTEEVLNGKGHPAFTNQVLLNAAMRLYVAQRVNGIEHGLDICKTIVESGAAAKRYEAWKLAMADHSL